MKQNNMFVKNLLKFASWTMAHASWMTMALSPVAMGKAAEKNSVEYYKSQVRAMGLDKGVTISEFFEKIKADLPGNAYYEFEQAVKHNPNAVMPKFEVKSAKASDGQVIPVITFTENGKTSTIQMYGDKDKFMKYNNVVVSENDSQNPATLFQKLIDNDSKLNQKYQDGLKKERQVSSKSAAQNSISSFTAIDKKLWKTMTAEQRVSYIIYMRQLYLDAQKVLSAEDSSKNPEKKTSSVNVFELLFKGLMPSAAAEDAEFWAVVSGKKVKVSTNKNAKECVVAGYVSQEAKTADGRVVCAVEVALKKDRYQPKAGSPLPFVSDANQSCRTQGESFVACNPIVYSYDSNGQPYCIDRNAAAFKTATHWDQGTNTCDGKSKLTNEKQDALKNTTEYKDLTKEEIEKTGNLAKTQEFIKNYLKSSGKEDFAACIQSTKITAKCEGLIAEITTIGNNFKKDINTAIGICNAGVGTADSKQAGACDQIRKRWLSYEALIAGLTCEDGSKPVEGKCSAKPVVVTSGDNTTTCPEPSTPSTEKGNGWCQCLSIYDNVKFFKAEDKEGVAKFCKKADVCTPDDDKPCPEPEEPEGQCSQYPPLKVGDKLNSDCTCKNKEGANGNIPKEDQPGFFDKLFNTKKNKQFKKPSTEDGTRKAKKATNNDQQREYSCKFGPNWWLVAGGALAVGGVIALAVFAAKKKTVTKTVTETKTVDNTVTCAPPKYAMLVTEHAPGSPTDAPVNRSFYKCVCPQSQRVCQMANGSTITVQANPITCDLPLCPTEGGTGTAPTTDSGGVPSQN